jgi:hypothetical protein
VLIVAFEPKFDLFSQLAGQYSGVVTAEGPGLHGTWSFQVPVAGMFNGKHVGVILVAKTRELSVLENESQVIVPLDIVGIEGALQGTIRVRNAPPGISATPLAVTVPAGQTVHVDVPLALVWGAGGLVADGVSRDVELSFQHGKGESTVHVALRGSSMPLCGGNPVGWDCPWGGTCHYVYLECPAGSHEDPHRPGCCVRDRK